jgi:hypothetical protein
MAAGALTDRYAAILHGVLSCYDRIIVTGTLPGACCAHGMTRFLYSRGVRIFDYWRGCLIGNLWQELASLDDAFREQLEAVLLSWARRVEQCLKQAVEVGQLAPESDAGAISRFFWIGWEGAVLRAKLTRNAEPLDQFVSMFFAMLAPGSPRVSPR